MLTWHFSTHNPDKSATFRDYAVKYTPLRFSNPAIFGSP
ncbi:hypothetical protein OHAE_4 [Ochrobactrum soli]|uniref:Uncharacterized protein n=1 Tax=Ochrobactrum soli TaxID=2448455 RepID=A0A2P9HJ83_9HYPH|nr:hypothetical protein OHAE_4 [[Ochrobactrum] soli]